MYSTGEDLHWLSWLPLLMDLLSLEGNWDPPWDVLICCDNKVFEWDRVFLLPTLEEDSSRPLLPMELLSLEGHWDQTLAVPIWCKWDREFLLTTLERKEFQSKICPEPEEGVIKEVKKEMKQKQAF